MVYGLPVERVGEAGEAGAFLLQVEGSCEPKIQLRIERARNIYLYLHVFTRAVSRQDFTTKN